MSLHTELMKHFRCKFAFLRLKLVQVHHVAQLLECVVKHDFTELEVSWNSKLGHKSLSFAVILSELLVHYEKLATTGCVREV